jgi:hypothetical protein
MKNPDLKIRFFTVLILAFICNISLLYAQAGQFIQAWGGPQYVSILNFGDFKSTYLGNYFGGNDTYRGGGGFEYINNFAPNYGWQTGIYYSGQGQRYSGVVGDYYMKKYYNIDTNISYTSQIWMDYIRVPLMFRFNSIMDEGDRMNISIFLGLQAGYLFGVRTVTNPNAPDSIFKNYTNFDYKKLYNVIDFGLGAGAQFNIRLNKKLNGNFGIRFDRSLMNIENSSYKLDSTAPVELQYPVSTKKQFRASQLDIQGRWPSKHMTVNVYLGISYKIKEGKPTRRRPVEESPQ